MGHNGNIAAAAIFGDTEAPATPAQPTAITICQTTFTLNWTATTDNVAVTGYKVWKGAALYQDVGLVLTKAITGQTAGASNNWSVSAYDAASNESAKSTARTVLQGVTVTSFQNSIVGKSTNNLACAEATATKYLTGGNSQPSNGETIYTDSCGSKKLNGGGNYYSDTVLAYQVSTVGVISNVSICQI